MGLQLDDPAILPPPNYEKEPETDTGSEIAVSPADSHRKAESIYDYLDALETQSERQLQSACGGPSSIGGRSTFSSVRSIEHRGSGKRAPVQSHDYAWEDGGGSEFDVLAPRSAGASPAPSYRSGASRINSDVSHQYYVGIKEKLATMAIELNDKTKTIELLKMARKKDRIKIKQLVAAEEDKCQAQLKEQQLHFDRELEKHLDFAQNLVTDKVRKVPSSRADLAKRCDELLAELQKANATTGREAERFKMQLKDAKDRWATQEKVRREQWIVKKTEEIKKSTVKALEPDIQVILQKGKVDLEKAQDVAAEERRKLQTQLEKAQDAALQRQKDEYERKLVDAREKERAKLMTRLDAADAELQQQLNNQRRRLQEEAEVARNELYAELRASKLAQAKEIEELKLLEAKRVERAMEKFQREKEDVIRKYESDFMALREETSVECEQFKAQLATKLRKEAEKEKQELEMQMLASRDAKIEVVIEKLQEESRAAIARAEQKAKTKFDTERKEWERKFKQTSEVEGVWMDKNRELHDKVAKLDQARDQLRAQNEELSGDAKRASDKSSELARLLHEERRMHESAVKQLEHRCASMQQDSEYGRQQQSAEVTALREKMETMDANFHAQVQKLQSEHDAELLNLHERVRSTIARKDQVIESLQEELHIMQVKLEKSHALIEDQRMQLFGE